jgi:hypothetical protein
LQRQHHADEDAGHHDDDQRHDAHGMQLLEQQPKPAADSATPQQCVKQENRRTPQYRDHVDPGPAEQSDAVQSLIFCASALPQKIGSVVRRRKVKRNRAVRIASHELTNARVIGIHQLFWRALPQHLTIAHYI